MSRPVSDCPRLWRTSGMTHDSSTPWMDVALAQMKLGPATIAGKKHNNPIVQDYLKSVGLGATDDDNWCGAFVNWCLAEAGYKSLGAAGNGKGARSWKEYGTLMTQPCPGAIVVFWRVSKYKSWKGHVAFYTHTAGARVHVLGGNQGPGRQITYSSFLKSTVLAYRWPVR